MKIDIPYSACLSRKQDKQEELFGGKFKIQTFQKSFMRKTTLKIVKHHDRFLSSVLKNNLLFLRQVYVKYKLKFTREIERTRPDISYKLDYFWR